jgi:hemerythrin
MEEQGYPELRHQQSEHAKFIRQLVEDAQSFSDSNPQSAFRFVRFLNDWLLSHIAIEDRQFREFRNKRDASSRNPPTETST